MYIGARVHCTKPGMGLIPSNRFVLALMVLFSCVQMAGSRDCVSRSTSELGTYNIPSFYRHGADGVGFISSARYPCEPQTVQGSTTKESYEFTSARPGLGCSRVVCWAPEMRNRRPRPRPAFGAIREDSIVLIATPRANVSRLRGWAEFCGYRYSR